MWPVKNSSYSKQHKAQTSRWFLCTAQCLKHKPQHGDQVSTGYAVKLCEQCTNSTVNIVADGKYFNCTNKGKFHYVTTLGPIHTQQSTVEKMKRIKLLIQSLVQTPLEESRYWEVSSSNWRKPRHLTRISRRTHSRETDPYIQRCRGHPNSKSRDRQRTFWKKGWPSYEWQGQTKNAQEVNAASQNTWKGNCW